VKGSSYRDRDYAFGQTMLAIRTRIGLTQVALADYLGVSRRAVGDWEAGNSYPKTEHLKKFVTLAIEQNAFSIGHEAEEIHALWNTSHQKLLFDEAWLKEVLSEAHYPTQVVTGRTQGAIQPRLDWDEALAIPNFYGRERELNMLTGWITQEHCRVLSVVGLGGIGKSAIVVHLMHQLANQFEIVIWRSLRDIPNTETLFDSILQTVDPDAHGKARTSSELRQSKLLEYLRQKRILLVLDNVETVLGEGKLAGLFLPNFEDIGHFLKISVETDHQSSILFTSREKPFELLELEGNQSPMRTLRLSRLDGNACEKLLLERNIQGTAAERAKLVDRYAGNPLALKITSQTILDLFDGQIASFLENGELIYGSIHDLLRRHFARLSALEQSVLLWLALLREPVTMDELLLLFARPVPHGHLIDAIKRLYDHSMVERGQEPGTFTLQSVVLEFVTAQLIDDVSREIQDGKPVRLLEHGLAMAQVREYIRQSQERLILVPILTKLSDTFLQNDELEKYIHSLLFQFTLWNAVEQGYGPANLVTILRLLRGNLRGMNLTKLSLRGLYLQGVEMQDTSLAGATIRDSIFTRAFDPAWSVAISNTGRYWAAGSGQGKVQIWREGGKVLHLAWQAHGGTVFSLAFSPDESRLATSSWDGSLRLWDTQNGNLLWMNWHTNNDIHCLAFSPDGRMLVSGGDDATVRLWDTLSGAHLQTLTGHKSPVHSLAWNPEGDLLASGSFDGGMFIWERPWERQTPRGGALEGHPYWVTGLVFSPDGDTLASASFDGTLRLWNIQNFVLRETLIGHTGPVLTVDWRSDGQLLASSGFDQTIRIWDINKSSTRMVLYGHGAAIYNIAFTPDNRGLLSSGDDGTLRLWDVERGQCTQIMQGRAASLYDVDWSHDGARIASASSDTLVTIWDVEKAIPYKILSGHFWLVFGVAWSPDARLLASSAWDNTVRIWDVNQETPLQIFQQPEHPDNGFQCVAWSPDGKFLASGSYMWGLHLWDVSSGTLQWIGREQSTRIRRVAWRPDGTQLASCGDDGSVFLWDASSGQSRASLKGHRGMVMSVVWNPDGLKIATAGGSKGNSEVIIWNALTHEEVHSWSEPGSIIYAVAWGLDGSLLLTGGTDGTVRWWDPERNECLRIIQAHQGTVQSIKVSPDGTTLATSGDDNAIQLWDIESGKHLQTLRRDRPYERLNISGVIGLTEAQKTALHALGAIELAG
jgi:WD40 repeat protein/transcriptional regulator with XRE-family HTH domain